jgi:putative ABC transport system permease protein
MVKMLDRKLLRDLWRVKTQVLTIALVVASGVGGFIGCLTTYDSLKSLQESYYNSARFAHVFARVKRAPLTVEAGIARIPGVTEAETCPMSWSPSPAASSRCQMAKRRA